MGDRGALSRQRVSEQAVGGQIFPAVPTHPFFIDSHSDDTTLDHPTLAAERAQARAENSTYVSQAVDEPRTQVSRLNDIEAVVADLKTAQEKKYNGNSSIFQPYHRHRLA